jgi:cytochrome c oxidase subunit IV
VAGVVQAYLQRILGMDYLTVQGFMKLWYTVFWVSGWGFLVGVLSYIVDFFGMRELKPVPGD